MLYLNNGQADREEGGRDSSTYSPGLIGSLFLHFTHTVVCFSSRSIITCFCTFSLPLPHLPPALPAVGGFVLFIYLHLVRVPVPIIHLLLPANLGLTHRIINIINISNLFQMMVEWWDGSRWEWEWDRALFALFRDMRLKWEEEGWGENGNSII